MGPRIYRLGVISDEITGVCATPSWSGFPQSSVNLECLYKSIGMPVEVAGGITLHFGDRDVEVSIGDAVDLVDGILKPVEFLKRIGV